jgi:hypothetical protein
MNNDQQWEIGNLPIPWVAPGDSTKYLGYQVNLWGDRGGRGKVAADLRQYLQRIGKGKLKPMQKLCILKDYALAQVIHRLAVFDLGETVSFNYLRSLDAEVRKVIKSWLKLPACATDAVLYTRQRDGGLGVPRLSKVIPNLTVGSLTRLRDSPDLSSVVDLLGIGGDLVKAVERSPGKAWRQDEFRRWEALPSAGVGVSLFRNDNIGNAWLKPCSQLRPFEYLDALKLRTNTIPTRVSMSRTTPGQDVNVTCRRCKAPMETLSHILMRCSFVATARIRRHDRLAKWLIDASVGEKWEVYPEMTVTAEDGTRLRPDVILVKGQTSVIIDVTVAFENDVGSLRKAFEAKVSKYNSLQASVERTFGTTCDRVGAFVVGARGAVCEQSRQFLSEVVGLKRKGWFEWGSKLALIESLRVIRLFMKVGRQEPAPRQRPSGFVRSGLMPHPTPGVEPRTPPVPPNTWWVVGAAL